MSLFPFQAFYCGQQPIFATSTNILVGLTAPDFDPQKFVYLPVESRPLLTVSNQTECKILRTRFSPHEVQIEIEAKAPALVVIAQSFYHPWHAFIDQRTAPLLRANHAFQALEAPAGHSQIVLRYQDRPFFAGSIISAISLGICVLWWVRSRRELYNA